jgi:hypothetical protein
MFRTPVSIIRSLPPLHMQPLVTVWCCVGCVLQPCSVDVHLVGFYSVLQPAILSLYGTKRHIVVSQTENVYGTVQTDSLKIIKLKFSLQSVKIFLYWIFYTCRNWKWTHSFFPESVKNYPVTRSHNSEKWRALFFTLILNYFCHLLAGKV